MSKIIRFATPEMFIDRMPISKSVDQELIKKTMFIEQDTTIHNLLGTCLYNNLLNEIDSDSISGRRLELIKDYLRPALFHLTMASLAVNLNLRVTDKGILNQTDDYAAQADERGRYKLESRHINKSDFYKRLAIKFICEYEQSFQDYCCDEDEGVRPDRKGYFSGIQFN